MEREELNALIREGPIRITMNDGRSFVVDGMEMAVVSDIAASALHRADDGRLKHIYLPLVTMTSVEPLVSGA